MRIFFFSAVFPFFNNVDETSHFDLVYKYSQGHFPRSAIERFDRLPIEMVILYGSPEYFKTAEQLQDNFPPPLWTQQSARQSKEFADIVENFKNFPDFEAGSPPVYYFAAGIWYNIGAALGLSGGLLLYWIRFLNVPIFMALVWLSWRAAQICFSDARQQLAVPLLMAFFPQDIFYSINADVLSPLLFAILFIMLLRIYFENKSLLYHLLAGLTAAAVFLTRMPNIAVPVLILAILILKIRTLRKENLLGRNLTKLCVMSAAAAIPVGLWLIRNYFVLGNLTGSADKIKFLGWTVKPFNQLWNHPIFTASGLSYFLAELTRTFWRGEFVWYFERLAWAPADLFYVASSAIFLTACLIGIVRNRQKRNQQYRFAVAMSFLAIGVSVLLLAVSAIFYDFHNCWEPSRAKPFFTSGRIISSVLLPFLLVYIDGLRRIFQRFRGPAIILIVMLIVIGITLSELWLIRNVITSPYNWFGLFYN